MNHTQYYGVNACVLQNSYAEIVTPGVMLLGRWVFRGPLDLEDGTFINGINVLKRGDVWACLPAVYSLSCEDTMRRWSSANQEAGSNQLRTCQHLGLPRLQNYRSKCFVY